MDIVRDQLRSAILAGELPPGSRLSVPDLARRFGVSRSPEREAVLLLVGEGLATEHLRRGVEVTRLEVADLLELYDLRGAIESLAARLAADRMSASELAALCGVLDAQGEAALGDATLFRELDLRFHHLIVEASGNERLKRHATLLFREMKLARPLFLDTFNHLTHSHQEHRLIAHALRQRDGPAAEQLMREHLRRVLTTVQSYHQPGSQGGPHA